MNHNRAAWFAVALVASLAACQKSGPKEELVAKVNGEGITKAQFETAVERNMARYRGQGHTLPPGIETRIKESVLRRMIDDLVIAQKAKSANLGVSDEELNAKFKEHKDRFRTEQAFQDYLKRSNNTEENMKEDLERNLLRDRVVEKLSGDISVSDEDVAKYYEENKQRFVEKEQVKASRILVRVAPNASDAERKKAQAKAQGLQKKAAAKGADFGALAKEASEGPEAARQGELGWMTRGRMSPEFDNVVFAMEPGSVSKVVDTKLGFEIVKLWEKKEERQRPMEEVAENIKSSLSARSRNQKRREVLQELKQQAKVEQLIQFEATPKAATASRATGTAGGLAKPHVAPSVPPAGSAKDSPNPPSKEAAPPSAEETVKQ
ncbi:MAG: peptidylprolyl isomerase [Myxococcota bacterium]